VEGTQENGRGGEGTLILCIPGSFFYLIVRRNNKNMTWRVEMLYRLFLMDDLSQ